mmetsp:Transcript_54112/g.128859  ORF Transcript_54112/g.128859 Transcript_54112/m.128859 type:complete len:326 (+) Transcript_54112:92-1069(+)
MLAALKTAVPLVHKGPALLNGPEFGLAPPRWLLHRTGSATARRSYSAVPKVRRHYSASSSSGGTEQASSAPVSAYLIRHGQSVWNLAAKQWDLRGLFSQVDHPLTPEGVSQAKRLRSAVEAASAAGDSDASRLLSADSRLLSSPLTRAVATSVLAFGTERPMRLVPEARELCYPIGGPDSIGKATGDAIPKRVVETLAQADGKHWLESHAALSEVLDTSSARSRWWSGIRETLATRDARLSTLLRKEIRTAAGPENHPVILVCHCMVIMRLFKSFTSPAFAAARPDWLAELRHKKLENCGVVRVSVGDEGLIDDADLVLNSKLLD